MKPEKAREIARHARSLVTPELKADFLERCHERILACANTGQYRAEVRCADYFEEVVDEACDQLVTDGYLVARFGGFIEVYYGPEDP